MNNLSATNKLQDGETHFATLLTIVGATGGHPDATMLEGNPGVEVSDERGIPVGQLCQHEPTSAQIRQSRPDSGLGLIHFANKS